MTAASRASLLAFASCLALAGPASAVVCVDPNDADCQPTIQAGVNAAAPGEVVQVAGGLYLEEVAIATQGVILRGGKGVVIDPSGLTPPANAITIGAANVAIEGIAIRNGDDAGIEINGVGGVRLSGVDIQSADDDCVEMNDVTPNAVIEDSRFRSCGGDAVASELSAGLTLTGNAFEDGVDVTGDGVRAERNTWSRAGGTCLSIEGAGAVVTGNRFDLCGGGAIEIDGDDPSVVRNSLANTDGTAIDVSGDDPVVESNTITGSSGVGIALFCDASCGTARIYRNRLSNVSSTAVSAESLDSNLQIEANQISQASGNGLSLETFAANVIGNRVTAAGGAGGECIDVDGDGNTVSGNSLATCGGDGVKADGDNNTIEGNRISGSGDDGIDVVDEGAGNQVLDNQASGAADNGIEVSPDATGTTVSENSASGLRADYCDGGTGTGGTDVPDDTTDCGDIDD
jgi:parallel beta-helix repeat protein